MIEKETKKLHPAYFIKQDLDELELTPAEFARRSGISEKQVSQLLGGKIAVTQALAEKLASFFGTSIQLWIGIQTDFDAYSRREERSREEAEDYALLMKVDKGFRNLFLVGKECQNKHDMVLSARRNLQVGRLEYLTQRNVFVALKETRDLSGLDFLQNVWISVADKKARDESDLSFKKEELQKRIGVFRELTLEDPRDFYPKLREEFRACGVHFVFVPYLAKSDIYGATKWMSGEGSPLIAVSNRGHSCDVFWFTLFHEISHVLMAEKKNTLASTKENTACEVEIKADKMAADLLIAPEAWRAFVARPSFSSASIILFSRKQGIHPGIVVGRLQKEGRLDPSYCNDLKCQYAASDFLEGS